MPAAIISSRRLRILFSTMPFLGHFFPLVPLAWSLGGRHDVAVASGPDFGTEIARAGLQALRAGFDAEGALAELVRRKPEESPEILERQRRVLSTDIAAPRMVEDLMNLIREWRPALLIHEEGELAAPIAARHLGIPCVTHGWPAPMMSVDRAHRLRAALAPLMNSSKPSYNPFSNLHGDLFLDSCPPSLNEAGVAYPGPRHLIRPMPYDGTSAAPGWLRALEAEPCAPGRRAPRARPLVYITLGTVRAFNRLPGAFSVVLGALRTAEIDLVVTVGPDNDPSALGACPANVRVERYIPQSRLLPFVDAVIAHGGAGTTTAALSHGLPLLILPRGAASQARIAAACGAAGAAIVCHDLDPRSLRDGVDALLGQRSYRRAAQCIARELESLPGPLDVVRLIETMAG